MSKPGFLVAFFILFCLFGSAQDQLFKKDNSKLLVEVLEVGPDEIRYKKADNLTGPVYVVKKSEVAMILYKNGSHETFNSTESAAQRETYAAGDAQIYPPTVRERAPRRMSSADSSKFFQYDQHLSIGFANLMNMEVCGMYQKDFFNSHVGLVVPWGVGVGAPGVTQSVYFGNNNRYWYDGNYNKYELKQKRFEIGLGLNYYPSLRYATHYYVGPVFRYMQYDGIQNYSLNNGGGWGTPTTYLTKKSVLTRYAFSITNGFIFRTRSRIVFNLFASLGFKNDVLSEVIIDPLTNQKINPIRNNVNIYFWGGFNLGFCF